MPKYFQIFMKFLPSGIPTISFKNILFKGFNITHPTVYNGFILMAFWMIGTFLIACIFLQRKKYI